MQKLLGQPWGQMGPSGSLGLALGNRGALSRVSPGVQAGNWRSCSGLISAVSLEILGGMWMLAGGRTSCPHPPRGPQNGQTLLPRPVPLFPASDSMKGCCLPSASCKLSPLHSLTYLVLLCDHRCDRTPSWASCSGKATERPKKRPGDGVQDMRASWDLRAGSPGVEAGQGCALHHRQGENHLHGGRRQKLCVCQGEGPGTTCYARRGHSCVTSTPGNKTLIRGVCLPISFHRQGGPGFGQPQAININIPNI